MTRFLTMFVLLAVAGTTACAGGGRRLARPETIDGVPCAERAWISADGRLESCTLAEATDFPGVRLPAGTRVGFAAPGRLDCVFLPGPTAIEGHVCRGRGHGFQTCFHPSGRLRFFNLERPETIDGVPCQRSSFWTEVLVGRAGVELHADGSLAGCLLAAPLERDGVRLDRGSRVALAPDGTLLAGR